MPTISRCGSSRRRSSKPQVNAPCEPPPWRASAIVGIEDANADLVGIIGAFVRSPSDEDVSVAERTLRGIGLYIGRGGIDEIFLTDHGCAFSFFSMSIALLD
jgi:hypothetical protein